MVVVFSRLEHMWRDELDLALPPSSQTGQLGWSGAYVPPPPVSLRVHQDPDSRFRVLSPWETLPGMIF